MKAYSTREVADLLGTTPERIRALARSALVDPSRDARGRLRFSFQDIVMLRTAQGLLRQRSGAKRVWRAIRTVGRQLHDRPLSAIKMHLEGDEVLVSAGNTTWNPESGQTLFDFSGEVSAERVSLAEKRSAALASRLAKSGEDWFELGVALESVGATLDAEAAYRNAFHVEPANVDSRINLGRLRHAARALDEAESLYRDALELCPRHGIALFNLGVVLEDKGAADEAMEAYRQALGCEPPVIEAHYNLARLYEERGDEQAALRHLASFKRLTDRTS